MSNNIIAHLVGIKKIYNHYTEHSLGLQFNILQPKKGGYLHSIKEWWQKRSGIQYVGCTILEFMAHDEKYYKLAVVSNNQTSLRFSYDGFLNFTFNHFKNVSRAALFTEDFQLIEHYVFPYDSRGKALTVIPQNAFPKPTFDYPEEELLTSDEINNSEDNGENNEEESTQNTNNGLPVVELSRPNDEETANS